MELTPGNDEEILYYSQNSLSEERESDFGLHFRSLRERVPSNFDRDGDSFLVESKESVMVQLIHDPSKAELS